METLHASYLLYQLTCCVNHLYSSSLLSNIRPSLCDPSLHCVISVVYSSPSNNPGTYITDNNIRILENQCLLNYYSYAYGCLLSLKRWFYLINLEMKMCPFKWELLRGTYSRYKYFWTENPFQGALCTVVFTLKPPPPYISIHKILFFTSPFAKRVFILSRKLDSKMFDSSKMKTIFSFLQPARLSTARKSSSKSAAKYLRWI